MKTSIKTLLVSCFTASLLLLVVGAPATLNAQSAANAISVAPVGSAATQWVWNGGQRRPELVVVASAEGESQPSNDDNPTLVKPSAKSTSNDQWGWNGGQRWPEPPAVTISATGPSIARGL